MSTTEFSGVEMMIIAASRELSNDDVCFVGIGAPSSACNLARLTHAPDITLIYESGTIGTEPSVLPLSIGDSELCDTALTTVSVPEMFRYWLQGGQMSIGFLGGAQIDKFGNINTTVIGTYNNPSVRLPGGGGAPEIATQCTKIFMVMRQSTRSFVNKIDFQTSLGFGSGHHDRANLNIKTAGPVVLVTDYAIWRPEPISKELTVTSIHPKVTQEDIQNTVGWKVKFANSVAKTTPPSELELTILRDLQERTKNVHSTKS